MRMGFGGSGTLPRCSRDDPEIIPRLSRDLRMGSGGSGTLPRCSRDYPEIIPRSADGLRWERYAPEMLPRLSRDHPEICGWAPVGAVRSRYAPEISDHARAACRGSPRRPFTSPQVRSRGLRHHRGRLPRVSALRLPGSAAGRAWAIRDPFWDGVAKRCDPWA
jgi:hypothetical protein